MGRKSTGKKERRALRAMMATTPGRTCGKCQECCWIPAIHETGKPPHDRCPHQCANGCGIYDDRPPVCKNFKCFWLAGEFNEEHRPDRIGLVVHGSTSESRALYGSPHVFVGSAVPLRDVDTSPKRVEVLNAISSFGNHMLVAAPDGELILEPVQSKSKARR